MTPPPSSASNVVALQTRSVRDSVSEVEWNARVDLAAAFRLCDVYAMSDMIYTHISARVPDEPNTFLLNAHGMLFNEITASSLLKVDLDGNLVTGPSDPRYGLHTAGFVIHSALYKARSDIMAAMHTHTIAGMAISALACGLLPLTQTATRFYTRLAYHDFNGPEREPAERAALAHDLGAHNVMILRNHGLLTVGTSMAQAFISMYGMERSCQAQAMAMACNAKLNELPQAVIDKAVAMYDPKVSRTYGALEWPGLLRQLDQKDTSYRT